MMNVLQMLGLGIVGFAITIGIGLVVLTRFAESVNDSDVTTEVTTLKGYLGSSGLAGWVPAIIALLVGGLFLAYFGGGGRRKGY